jgi:hypothetical protein
VVALTGIVMFAPAAASFAGQVADGAQAIVLVTTYADGRTVHHVVTGRPGHSWTPYFPRTASPQTLDGSLPVRALSYRSRLTENGAVQVDISVFRGDGHEQKEPVAQVVVERDERVTIDALRGFGVLPVTLSLTTLAPSALTAPAVLNRTSGLEVVDIAITEEPAARYRLTVKNLSSRPAVNFHVIAHRNDRRALSGNRGNLDSTPIIEPGASYTFTLDPGREVRGRRGEVTLASHDVIEIAAVLWEDGEVEGDPAPMASALAIYHARAAQLTRGVELLRVRLADTGALRREALRAQLESLPTVPDDNLVSRVRERLRHFENLNASELAATMQATLAFVRHGMIEDLDAAPAHPAAFEQWLHEIITVYERQAWRFMRR